MEKTRKRQKERRKEENRRKGGKGQKEGKRKGKNRRRKDGNCAQAVYFAWKKKEKGTGELDKKNKKTSIHLLDSRGQNLDTISPIIREGENEAFFQVWNQPEHELLSFSLSLGCVCVLCDGGVVTIASWTCSLTLIVLCRRPCHKP